MQLIKRVILSAKERALTKFSELGRLAVNDAESAISAAIAEARSGVDQRQLNAALQQLRYEGVGITRRMETLFRESVERALQTMYTDLRQGLNNLSADKLSLIDDDTVTKQMEVGHLVQRLRDACDENLGRLNIIIAQIHGDPDVNERENPFRPYLIARALYEVLREKITDEENSKLLFDYLSAAIARHLSEYYASICEVFDASGIQAKLLARPAKLKRHQRDQLAQQLAARKLPNQHINITGGPGAAGKGGDAEIQSRVMPTLQRMMELMQKMAPAAPGTAQAGGANQEEFQDFVWKLFNQSKAIGSQTPSSGNQAASGSASGAAAAQNGVAPASPALLSRLDQFQQLAASGQSVKEGVAPETNQLFAVGEKLNSGDATQGERVAIDVIAVLFEFILEDEQIPAAMRLQIGRLQIPFLKAAMLSPDLLQNPEHPARQLLNRMSTAAIGLDPESAIGKSLSAEVVRIVKRILQGFEKDAAIFADCLQELEQFLAKQLRNADAETALSVQAVEEAEQVSVLLHNTETALRDIVTPYNLDHRAVDFILRIWARVLVRASMQEVKSAAGSGISQQYRDVLPELVWSAQEKLTPQDRTALIKVLPSLVKRLKIGMLMIHLPEDEVKTALDQLVAVHTQILRPNPVIDPSIKLPTLDELRQQFSRLVIDKDNAAWTLAEPPQIEEEVVESVLADRGATAELDLERPSGYSRASDVEWLAQMHLGMCVQCWAGDTSVLARLIWISRHKSLFIFKMDQNAKPLVYAAAALVKALREGSLRLVEYAPAFDRAVDSLMLGAEVVQAGGGE